MDGQVGCRRHEDDVKIGNGQEISRTRFGPSRLGGAVAFRAVTIAARIVSRSRYAAGLADLDMTAERGGAAQLQVVHHTPFAPASAAPQRRGR